MIVATYFGMFMPALRPLDLKTGKIKHMGSDARELQVRSRRAIDLDRLRERYLPTLGETIHLKDTDYQYRAYCTREEWGAALAAIAADIDYTKFKDTPAKYLKDDKLAHCYSDIWHAAFNAFPTGSVYDFKKGQRGFSYHNSTVIHDEAVEWKRPSQLTEAEKLAAARQWDDMEPDPADLALIEQLDADLWNLSQAQRQLQFDHYTRGDHSKCQHPKTKNARRKCRRQHGSTGGR